jgi:tetratricopeptide (TPR) repeat protein
LIARTFGLVVILMFGVCLPEPARADLPSAESSTELRRGEAKLRFNEGVNAFREHRYADAVQAFLKADALAPSAALSFNIGRSFERLENHSSALRWYRDYLRRTPQAANAAQVEARVTELAEKLALRGVQQLSVLSTPDGAAVTIDNRPMGVTPITLELAPGTHHLHLRLAGYRDQQQDIVLEARKPQDVVLRLESLQSTALPRTGAAGSGARDSATAAAAARPPFGVAPWLVLGAGGVSFVAALSFELARRSAESEAKSAPQREYQVHYDAMRSRQTTARVLTGVGGALLVTGGVLLVLNTPRRPQLGAACGPDGCRAVALGSF